MAIKKRALGRGLESLLSDVSKPQQVDVSELSTQSGDGLTHLPLDKIQAGKYQPRQAFSEQSIKELADSIQMQGVIQPIVVRKVNAQNYEIIAGERRWRAAKLAKLNTIPALIRELSDTQAIAMALIENIQREDLNPIDQASALQRLIDEFAMTHQQIADSVGKSRTNVSNLLRLLSLTDSVRTLLEQGKLEMGHARALLTLSENEQQACARKIINLGLSVRETENLVRRLQNNDKKMTEKEDLTPALLATKQRLKQLINAPVTISQNASGRGKIVIKYKNQQDLDRIVKQIEK